MNRKTTLILAIVALISFSSIGLAQGGKKKLPREAEKMTRPPGAEITSEADPKKLPREAEKTTTRKPERDGRELSAAFADKKFLDACEILAANGEMFQIDSAQLTSDGSQSMITFAVVKEATKEPGQYRQLVYAFDGKESAAYFNDKNPVYVETKTRSGSASKLKWPPAWWPGSGGGSTGLGGGFEWTDWHQVGIDNCHATFICPMIHVGKMAQEERTSKSNPSIRQTRWLLLSCGCSS